MYSLKIFIWYLVCECDTNGTVKGLNNCDKETGACDTNPGCRNQFVGNNCGTCPEKYAGRQCNECEVGYFGYPICKGL